MGILQTFDRFLIFMENAIQDLPQFSFPFPYSHSRFKVAYPVPIQGWISQASKLQTCYKFQKFIFLGRQVIRTIYVIIKQLCMGFIAALYGNTLPIYATLN